MSYNKNQQHLDTLSQRKQMDRQGFVQQQASVQMKSFDWADENLGIRRVDTVIFKAAARVFNHII